MRFERLLWRLPQFAPPIPALERRVYASAPVVALGCGVCVLYSLAYRLALFFGKKAGFVAPGESLPRSRAQNQAHARLMETVHWWCWLLLGATAGAAAWIGTDGLLLGSLANGLGIVLSRWRRAWLLDYRTAAL